MQEPMNMTIHRWSYSWYRSRYCPSSIVQDGGDTTINGTVPIYLRASPDLCHHVGRGINPRGRAVTVLSDSTCAIDLDLTPHQFTPIPVDFIDDLSIASTNNNFTQRIISQALSVLALPVFSTIFLSSDKCRHQSQLLRLYPNHTDSPHLTEITLYEHLTTEFTGTRSELWSLGDVESGDIIEPEDKTPLRPGETSV